MNRNPFAARSLFRILGVLVCIAAGAAHAAAARTWTLVDIGALGPKGSAPFALNNRGEVAGGSIAVAGGFERQHAFLWQHGVMHDLGQAFAGGNAGSFITAMNDKGALAGIVDGKPYLWHDGVAGALPFDGVPLDINKSEAIAGGYWTGPAREEPPFHAFLFQNATFLDLGTLGGKHSNANAVNDKGVVTGFSNPFDDRINHAFVYQGGVMKDLGTLGGDESFGRDINNHGVVVGTSHDASGNLLAFIHDPRGGMRPLLDTSSTAAGINDRGDVVGTTPDHAFLYEDGIVTLLDRIPEVVAAGWTRLQPSAINDRGWIAGVGIKPGGPAEGTGFLLIPR